jgi:hypothetical protein
MITFLDECPEECLREAGSGSVTPVYQFPDFTLMFLFYHS